MSAADDARAEPAEGAAAEASARPVRRPVFHVFEEFYRRAIRGRADGRPEPREA